MRSVLRVVGVVGVILFAFCLLLGPLDWLFWLVWHLAAGWAYYLGRTLPQLRPNPAEFAVAGVALAVVTVGGHRLGRWLYGPGWRTAWTAKAVGLFVLLFACGTAAVGVAHQTAWLVRSPDGLTHTSGGMREAAGRIRLSNQLKQLGLAAHNHHDARGVLPAPTFTPDGRPLHSWHTHLLPHLEQDNMYHALNLSKPWGDPVNRPVAEVRVNVFDHPFAPLPVAGVPAPTYLAPNNRLFDRPRRLDADGFPLGTSNTVLAGEALIDPRPWADPLNGRDGQRPLDSPGGFAGVKGRPVQVLMADGRVRSVTSAGWAPVTRGEPLGDE